MPIARFRSKVEGVASGTISVQSAFVELDEAAMKASMDVLVTARHDLKTQKDLDRFVSDLYTKTWEPDLPVWRAFVINDLEDGRSLLLMKIDHAIADGVGLLDVLFNIIDSKGGDSPRKSRSAITRPPSCWEGFKMQAKGLWRACYGPFIADHLPGDRKNRLKFADAKNPGSTKAVCSTKPIDLNDIKMIKSQLPDATDILMTLTCLTLRNYYAKYEPSTLKQSVRANMPISMRKEGDEDIFNPLVFGNNFSQGQLSFPIHLEDPMEIFRSMKAQIDVIKVSPEPLVRHALVKMLTVGSPIPHRTAAALVLDQFGKVTAMLSNVVGPMQEVEFMGKKLDDMSFYAMVPLGLYFGIVQYNGWIKVGICCDGGLEPEPQRLADCWEEAFQALRKAAEMAMPEVTTAKCALQGRSFTWCRVGGGTCTLLSASARKGHPLDPALRDHDLYKSGAKAGGVTKERDLERSGAVWDYCEPDLGLTSSGSAPRTAHGAMCAWRGDLLRRYAEDPYYLNQDGSINLAKVPLRDRLSVDAMLQYQKDPVHQHLCTTTDDSGVFRICPTTVDDERPELAGLGWNASHSWDFCSERFADPASGAVEEAWRPPTTDTSVHEEVSEPLPPPQAPELPERPEEPPEELRLGDIEEPVGYIPPPVPAASAEELVTHPNDQMELHAAQTAQQAAMPCLPPTWCSWRRSTRHSRSMKPGRSSCRRYADFLVSCV
eukprot:s1900_g5.t1